MIWLKQLQSLSPADKLKISQACGGAKPKVKDVAQTVLTSGLQLKITFFSGDGAKGDASFPQWRLEVRCMVRDNIYTDPVILQTLRR